MGNCYNSKENVDKNTEIVGNEGEFDRFAIDALKSHNEYREKHGVPKLILNKRLCQFSQDWVNNLASTNNFEHSECVWENKQVGENIAMCQGRILDGKFATDIWYEEIKNYDFNNPGFGSETGHFTQVIWKESRELGIAYAKNGDVYFAVANYYPAGNEEGRYNENVFTPN